MRHPAVPTLTKSKPGTNPKEVAAKIWQLAPPILIHPQQKTTSRTVFASIRGEKTSPNPHPPFVCFVSFVVKKKAFPIRAIRAIRAIRGSKTKPANSPPIMVKKTASPHPYPSKAKNSRPIRVNSCPFVVKKLPRNPLAHFVCFVSFVVKKNASVEFNGHHRGDRSKARPKCRENSPTSGSRELPLFRRSLFRYKSPPAETLS